MLSTYDLEVSVLIAATLVGYGYVVYSALAIRRTIAGRIYRRQALGLSLVAIVYALNTVTSYYNSSGFDFYDLLGLLSFPLAFITIFYWVDTSVLAARLTDPLLRDTLHWSKVRFLILTFDFSALIFSFSYMIYLSLTTKVFPTSPPFFLLAVYVTPAYVSVGPGAAVLLVAIRRTADRTLRRHLKWFGFYLVFIFAFGGIIGNGLAVYSVVWSNLVGGAANAAGAFFLYKSARSLIPLYRFSDQAADRQAPLAVSQT
jgi:hypothetical protein